MNISAFFRALVLVTFLFAAPQAFSKTSHPYSCIFERPFIFGASISAGYKDFWDAFRGVLSSRPIRGRQYSPIEGMGEVLIGNRFQSVNVAEIINTMDFSSYGTDQFFHYFSDLPDAPYELSEFTLLASLDGSFWPSVKAGTDLNCMLQAADLKTMIDVTNRAGVPLILGTVPTEKPEHILPAIRKYLGSPSDSCAKIINDTLKFNCKASRHCFLIPVHKVVEDLRSPQGITYKGTNYRAIDYEAFFAAHGRNSESLKKLKNIPKLREDGIHLSLAGVNYAIGLIHKELMKAPDLCRN